MSAIVFTVEDWQNGGRRKISMAHEWEYDAGKGPFSLFVGNVGGIGEDPCYLIETSLPQKTEESYLEEGILLDACAEEIMRLADIVTALEGEIERLKAEGREEFAVLRGALDELKDRHARTEALSDKWLRPDGSQR